MGLNLGGFAGDVFKGAVETVVRPFETVSGKNLYDPTYNTKAGQAFDKFDGFMDKVTGAQMLIGATVLGTKGLLPNGQPAPAGYDPAALARQNGSASAGGPDPKLLMAGGGAVVLIVLLLLILK